MDDILAKHLAKTLLFKEKKKRVINENSVKEGFYKYKLIDDKYYVNFGSDLIVSEKIGTWKNKDVVLINKNKYVVLENSNTIIPLNHLSDEEFKNNFIKDKTVQKKKKDIQQNPTFLQSSKKEEITKQPTIKKEEPLEKEEPIFKQKEESVLKQKEEAIIPAQKEQEEETSTEKYIDDIKKSKNTEKVEEDAEEDAETKSFFDLLEKKKDDPRVKKFFNYHADHMKKEFTQIIEKVKTTQFARAMESGGGTNAVQYANGGTMNGNLTVTEQIVGQVVTDTSGRQLVHKKTFNIVGNGSDKEFIFTHNFNTKDILINVYDSNNYSLVTISSVNIDLNNTQITFPNILAVGENYRVILIA